MIKANKLKNNIICYLKENNLGDVYRYKSSCDGQETLYASCFALMILHYLGEFDNIPIDDQNKWAEYILSYQDEKTGYFVGPEISQGRLLSNAHSKDHLSMHLTAHVLPAMKILNIKPKYSLNFALKYMDINSLDDFLNEIDWTKAWIEGNNLLFVGQFLLFLYEECGVLEAKPALDRLFNWLDNQLDSKTGLWGTNGYTDIFSAIYGGYHQLILYYYYQRDVRYKENLIDSVLSIQHIDGGFSKHFGGGSCEDVDCVDILVNMYKRSSYKHKEIQTSLKKAANNVLRKLNCEGGFYYKINTDFYHMGMEYTYSAPQNANMFSTWFSLHTLLLIGEVIDLPCVNNINYKYNPSCSMGWHSKSSHKKVRYFGTDYFSIMISALLYYIYFKAVYIKDNNLYINRMYNYIRGK